MPEVLGGNVKIPEINQSISSICKSYYKNKLKEVYEGSLGVLQNDKHKIGKLFGTFHLLGWKSVAEKINIYSESVTLESMESAARLGYDMPYQLSQRQRDKAIVMLLGKMLMHYANQISSSSGPFDCEIEFTDLKQGVSFFEVGEDIILEAMDYARQYYKSYFNKDIPNSICRLENFT